MPQEKRRVVQTELELGDYEAFCNLAKGKSMTIKEAVREACSMECLLLPTFLKTRSSN